MIASWLRLRSFVEGADEATPQEAYAALGRRGIEGEGLVSLRALAEGVLVAEVAAVRSLPERDLLDLDLVVGARRARVVTGERSVAEGERVAWAPPGAMVGGRALGVRVMAGIASEGMLVSPAELGMGGDGKRVLRVPGGVHGSRLAEALEDDWLMTFSVTPNRGDCLSHFGLAREWAAALGATLRLPAFEVLDDRDGAPRIELEDPDCPWYLGVLLELAEPLKAGDAATTALVERCGMRSIGPIVDLTNEVLLELGQPLHAFDADQIRGTVVVRSARPGELFTGLDNVERKLTGAELVIADDEGVLALAGVIGGARAEVGPDTTRILLESAHFRPSRVMRGRRPHKLSTEASTRFERGVDPQGVVRAAGRFVAGLRALAGDSLRIAGVRRVGRIPGRRDVRWDVERARRLLGALPPESEAESLLDRLGFVVIDEDSTHRVVPSWRFDIESPVDLIEEVARAWGYDRFAPTLPAAPLVAPRGPSAARLRDRVLDAAVARGFQQAIHLAFAPTGAGRVQIANPLGEQTGALRDDLLTHLLAATAHNHRHQETDVRLVETGVVFRPDGTGVAEAWHLGLVWSGLADPCAWRDRRPVDLWDLKGVTESLIALVAPGLRFEARPGDVRDPRLHPVRVAELMLEGRPFGFVAELDPAWAAEADLIGAVAVAELDLDLLADLPPQTPPQSKPLSRFPASQRDLAFLLPRAVPAAELLRVVREAVRGPLVDAQVFDLYEGKGIPEGQRSLAIRLTWRDHAGPVAHDVLDGDVERVVAAVTAELSGRLRA